MAAPTSARPDDPGNPISFAFTFLGLAEAHLAVVAQPAIGAIELRIRKPAASLWRSCWRQPRQLDWPRGCSRRAAAGRRRARCELLPPASSREVSSQARSAG